MPVVFKRLPQLFPALAERLLQFPADRPFILESCLHGFQIAVTDFALPVSGDVVEYTGEPAFSETERGYFVIPFQGARMMFEMDRITSQCDLAVGVDPEWFRVRQHFKDGFPENVRCMEAGQGLERRVDCEEPVIDRAAVRSCNAAA